MDSLKQETQGLQKEKEVRLFSSLGVYFSSFLKLECFCSNKN